LAEKRLYVWYGIYNEGKNQFIGITDKMQEIKIDDFTNEGVELINSIKTFYINNTQKILEEELKIIKSLRIL
jgi:hypothetical protein